MIEHSNKSTGTSSGYFDGTGGSLERPSLSRRRVSSQTSMPNSVHLDCSQASVGALRGIAEGATVSISLIIVCISPSDKLINYCELIVCISPPNNLIL